MMYMYPYTIVDVSFDGWAQEKSSEWVEVLGPNAIPDCRRGREMIETLSMCSDIMSGSFCRKIKVGGICGFDAGCTDL